MSGTTIVSSREEIFTHLKQLLVEHFEMQEESITLDARLYEDLDIDSIDAVDLIVELKRITGKKLDPKAFKEVRTVEDVVAALYDLVNE